MQGSIFKTEEWKKQNLIKNFGPGFINKQIYFLKGYLSNKEIENFFVQSKNYFCGQLHPVGLFLKPKTIKKFCFTKIKNHTIILDLTKSEKDLWAGLEKKSIRWGVNTAIKKGLKFRVSDFEQDARTFYELYSEKAKQFGLKAKEEKYVFELLKTGFAKLIVVEKDGVFLAGLLLLFDFDSGYSILDLSTSNDLGYKLQAGPFLYWNAILYSKKQGLSTFDFGGCDPEAKNGKSANLFNFKEKFGGALIEQPMFVTTTKYLVLSNIAKKIGLAKSFFRKLF